MEEIISTLLKTYKSSDLDEPFKEIYQLTLYLTQDDELHLINTWGHGVYCHTTRRYSSISSKQLKITRGILDKKWKVSKFHSCEHATFSSLTISDLKEGWPDRLMVKKAAYPYLLRSV